MSSVYRRLFLRISLPVIGCTLSLLAASQTCKPTFKKTYDGAGFDEGTSVAQTSDGGVIIAGRTSTGAILFDGLLIKTDSAGNIQWTKSYATPEYDDFVSVKQTADGGYIAIGNSRANFNPGAWIVKTDANGVLLWSKRVRIVGDYVTGKDIIQLPDQSYVAAIVYRDSSVYSDAIIMRITASGSGFMWCKRFNQGGSDEVGKLGFDGTNILAGGHVTGDNKDGMIMRIDPATGGFLWGRKFARWAGQQDNLCGFSRINGGYAFCIDSRMAGAVSAGGALSFIKMRDDTTFSYSRDVSTSTATGSGFRVTDMKVTPDEGFIFSFIDTTAARNGVFGKIGPIGLGEWNQASPSFMQYAAINGVASYDSTGYLATGGWRQATWPVTPSVKVQLIKTNLLGQNGYCGINNGSNWTDTIHNFINQPFTWTSIIDEPMTYENLPVVTNTLNFVTETICFKMDCFPTPTVSPVACNTTLLAHYPGLFRSIPFDVIKTTDGYFLSGFTQRYSGEPLLSKINLNGTLSWSKTLNNYIHDGAIGKMTEGTDGNILLTGPDGHVIDHQAHTNALVVKVNPAGTVLWSKYIDGSIFDLHPIANGGFDAILLFNLSTPPVSVARIRIDAAGNITYGKRFGSFSDMVPAYKKYVIDGNFIYASGELYDRVVIEKLDSAGVRQWSQTFQVDGKPAIVESLDIIGDSVYATFRYFTTGYKETIAMVKVSKTGNGLNALSLKPDIAGDALGYSFFSQLRITKTIKTADDHFIVADRVARATDSVVVVTKYAASGSMIWSKVFPALNKHKVGAVKEANGAILITGYKMLPDPYYSNNSAQPFLMVLNAQGELLGGLPGSCEGIPGIASSAPVNLVPVFIAQAPFPTFNFTNFSTIPYQVMERPIAMGDSVSCSVAAACSFMDLVGEDSICNFSDTLVYRILKDPLCNTGATWSFDAAYAKMITSTDSTIALQFLKPGQTKLYALSQTACGTIKDSLTVNIALPADSLRLQNDTTLCAATSFVIKARKGYQSYTWQDGSVDSFFIVTQPGLYHLRVTDMCGKTKSDSVLVEPHPPIPFTLGPDKAKCNGDTLNITAPAGFMNYQWSPAYNISALNTASVNLHPAVDTVYYLKAEKTPGCFAYDTIKIKVHHSALIDLGNNKTFCSGDSVSFDAGAGFMNYLWSTTANTQTITVKTAGQFSVKATDLNGCSSYDTVVTTLLPLPAVTLDHNPGLCAGETRTLNAGVFSSYTWQDGSTASTYLVTAPGVYWVVVMDNNGCKNADTSRILNFYPSPASFLMGDTTICSYGKLTLRSILPFNSYNWNNGSTTSSITIEKPGTYWLQVSDANNCKGRDSVNVALKDCMKGIYVPTAFTPNNDGRNDNFRAMVFGPLKSFRLTVYNRWGEVVFTTTDPFKSWDGKLKGADGDTHVFVWTCDYEFVGEKKSQTKGTVTILR